MHNVLTRFVLVLSLVIAGIACGSKSSTPTPIEDTAPTPDTATPDSAPLPTDTPVVPEDASEPDTATPPEDAPEPEDVPAPKDVPGPEDTPPAPDTAPATCDPPCPEGQLCFAGQCGTQACDVAAFDGILFANAKKLSDAVLMTEQPDSSWAPSIVYQWSDLLQALHTACGAGIAGYTFWIGNDTDPDEKKFLYGLVNLAAFLAQSMKETIKYDACDENNWDNINGYPLAGSCGQLGQKYEDYDCEMACPKDPSMQLTAVTNAKWWGAPGPMFCAPDSALIAAGVSTDGSTGYWNHNADCWPYPAAEPDFTVDESVPTYLRPECEVYKGQKGGKYVFDGSSGSVQGCCWWGRGVIQTTGRCNFGKLNHYLGKSHLDSTLFPAPDAPPYPNVDFCKDPERICASKEHPELKWIAGLFYWMNDVQAYNQEGWVYTEQVKAFVDGGFQGTAFIDAVSGIVNRGCHNPPCGTGPVDGLAERAANFQKALTAMDIQ